MSSDERTLQLQGVYNNLYNTTTRPDYKFVVSRYFIDEWLPLLGPSVAWLVVGLRQRCFHNQRQDWCVVNKATLAQETAMSERTIERSLQKPLSRWFVLEVVHRYRYRSELGKTVRDKNRYQLLLDEPLSPRHQLGLSHILAEMASHGSEDNLEAALQAVQTILALPHLTDKISYQGPMPKQLERQTILELVEQAFTLNLPSQARDERVMQLDQFCAQLYNQIVQPNKIYVGWQYFRRQWTPLLGHALSWLIIYMRRHCFWDETSGELRDIFRASKKETAAAIGQTTRNLTNLLQNPHAHLFFNAPPPEAAPQKSSPTATLCYQVRMVDEPLTADDWSQIATELQQRLQGQYFGKDPEHGQLNAFPLLDPSPNRQNFTYGRPLAEIMTDRSSTAENMPDKLEILTVRDIQSEIVTHRSEIVTGRPPKTRNSDGNERNSDGQVRKNVATLKDSFQDSNHDLLIKRQQQIQISAAASNKNLVAVLNDLSIQEPVRSQLLANKKLTAPTVQAWFLYAETQPGLIEPRGYALKRLLAHDSPPKEFVTLAQLDSELWPRFALLADRLTTGQPLEEPVAPELHEAFIIWATIYADLPPADTRRLLAHQDTARDTAELKPDIPPALAEARQLWQQALAQLQFQMTRQTFDTWLRHTEVVQHEDEIFVVEVQSEAAKAWLENRLSTLIDRTLATVTQRPATVRFVLPRG